MRIPPLQSKVNIKIGVILASSFIIFKRKETSMKSFNEPLSFSKKRRGKFHNLLNMSEDRSVNDWYVFKSLSYFRRLLSTMILAVQQTPSSKASPSSRKTSTLSNSGAEIDMDEDKFKEILKQLNSNQLLFLLISLSNEIAKYFDLEILIPDSDLETLIKSNSVSVKTVPAVKSDLDREIKCSVIDGQLLAKFFASLVVYSKDENFAQVITQRADLIIELLKVIYLDPSVEKLPARPKPQPSLEEAEVANELENLMDNFDDDGYHKKSSTHLRHYNSNPTSDALEDILSYKADASCNTKTDETSASSSRNIGRVFFNLDLQCQVELGTFLANVSRLPGSIRLFRSERMKKFNRIWKESRSLHLNLLSNKMNLNMETHEAVEKSNSMQGAIYSNDIYCLDHDINISKKKDYDVVFINGMNGSVFYTWRQHEKGQLIRSIDMGVNEVKTFNDLEENESYTKCWPRDWLSEKFPNSRIVGVNVSLKPFFWNSICPHDKKRRLIRDRAVDIAVQLRQSGVGDRPIVWISHSAGGIIVKEILRFVNDKEYLDSYLENMQTSAKKLPDREDNKALVIKSFLVKPNKRKFSETSTVDDVSDLTAALHMHQSDFIEKEKNTQIIQKVFANIRIPETLKAEDQRIRQSFLNLQMNDLSERTSGLFFISTPHRGNQSLYTLYHYPFKFALTPEAKELERNGPAITELHDWFLKWIGYKKIPIVNMIETEATKCNNLYSCILVPEDPQDQEYSEIIRVKSDHIYISKPDSPKDQQFLEIVNFLDKTFK